MSNTVPNSYLVASKYKSTPCYESSSSLKWMSMSEKLDSIGRAIRPAAEIAAASAAMALGDVGIITARNHRELTHKSLVLHPWLQVLADAEQRTYGVGETTIWAAVHRIHHSIPDATLFPFYRISRAIKWMEQNPQKAKGVTIPESFKNLYPYVDSFALDDVMEIGTQAEQFMKKRLGDLYEEPEGYTKDELRELLNPAQPTYFYPTEKHVGAYSQEDVAEILLGDPHSPVRIPPPEFNGVRGVVKQNVSLYTHHADLFRARPEIKEPDLQLANGGNRRASRMDIAVGVLIPSFAVLLRRGKVKPKDFAIALATGAIIYATKTGMVIAGGNIVNSLGHAGELTQRTLITAVQRERFKPHPNEDGTISTDTSEAGFLGWLLGLVTLDEVGGQEEHHHSPEKIAYTSKKGFGAWLEAPWGMTLQTLAHSKLFPFIQPGPGFDLDEGETRPDQPHPAMEIIHARRAEQLRRNPTQ